MMGWARSAGASAYGCSFSDELVADSLRLAALERILERIVLRAIDVNEHLIGAIPTALEKYAPYVEHVDRFLKAREPDQAAEEKGP
jgi:hypothetical protein